MGHPTKSIKSKEPYTKPIFFIKEGNIMSTIIQSNEEPHPSLSLYVPYKILSNFTFASQYFDEQYGWKGQGLGKYEHGLVELIIVEPHLFLDKPGSSYQK